ncbi:MAG: DUF5011 domain-containing protein [Epsilonproteobacteria bacterium]|nr:DUF5011 domain-containing protein [Campylobacterota bacterium]
MKIIHILAIVFVMLFTVLDATTVYSDAEDGTISGWTIGEGSDEGASIDNVYNAELDSRVIRLAAGGSYELNLANGESWNNRTERVLSFRMNYTDRYTIYVSVDTTDGHRWLFFNDLNGHWGYHGAGILSGFGNAQSHNGTWQTVTLDLDEELRTAEPNLEIIRVNGMQFNGWGGLIDNVTLDAPERTTYENGENGIVNWQVTDNDPAGATVTVVHDDEEVLYRGEINGEQRTDPFMYAYDDNVISLSGDGQNNAFTIGAVNGVNAWNNTTQTTLQWKMRNTEMFTVIVHIQTQEGEKRLVYTPTRPDNGLSEDELEIHHGLGISRNGDGVASTTHTGGLWLTYTRDLIDDLRDYDPDNQLIAINGMTIQGNTLIDDIQLLSVVEANYVYPEPDRNTFYEDAEDGSINGWSVRSGPADGVNNIYDAVSNSRVIQLTGGGSYMLGDFDGATAWNHTTDTNIAWRMRTDREYTIHVLVQTTNGLRHLFYTFSPNRGLLHGFENGIHHGLGAATIDGRWRTITRDLERDLKDAEPDNEIIAVNGFIYNGGDGGMIDDIVLYTPDEIVYEDGESGIDGWVVSDNDPAGATISNIADNDRQGRHLQGNVISLIGSGANNAYSIGGAWNNSEQKIVQWKFRNFGGELEVLSADPDARGTIRDVEAFEFRVSVETSEGVRDLVYSLGSTHQGVIENGAAIHHGLGDDRIRGSVWAGDDPMNALGLWQTITRDLEEDIRDFEPNNSLVAVNGFQVRNSGLVDDIKLLSNAIVYELEPIDPITVYEDAENEDIEGWSLFANASGEGTVTNVYDDTKQSRVINLQGVGRGDGYILGSRTGTGAWDDRTKNIIRWSMNYEEDFTIYISTETTNGRRYLTYSQREDNGGLNGQYISIGLGAGARDGTWQTFTRNIAADLESFEVGNALFSINAFMVRGSGRVDDIQTLSSFDVPVVDTIRPVLTRLGNAVENILVGSEYVDAGASAVDNIDGDITPNIVTVNPVNTEVVGAYTVSYNVVDVAGNSAVEVTRVVNIGEVPDPVTSYEDAENSNTEGWSIFANTSGEATITNSYDNDKQSRVIVLQGSGKGDGYMLGARTGDNAWSNTDGRYMRWSMNYDEDFTIYISVETTNGRRYLTYTPRDDDRGLSGEYIRLGLGANASDGTWQTFTRDLLADIQSAEPANELISVNAFMIRGSGRVDDMALSSEEFSDVVDTSINYEDAEDETTEGWSIYINSSGEATVSNVFDDVKQSRVIVLQGSGKGDGYMLGARNGDDAWNNTEHHTLQWSMNYAEDFTIYISVETTNGRRYLTYTPRDDDRGLSGQYVLLGLGADADNGTWQTFTRNIATDITDAEAGNELISVNAFMIRGSGRVDDIRAF